MLIKGRYKVDLARQLAECEANYWRLRKLLPRERPARGEQWHLAITSGDHSWQTRFRVIEDSRYTTTVQIHQTDVRDRSDWLRSPRLTVRLYRDAGLAEVLAWERHRHLQPRYDYPNRAMYQRDEKAQLNRFLGEWLGLCLARGHRLEPVW